MQEGHPPMNLDANNSYGQGGTPGIPSSGNQIFTFPLATFAATGALENKVLASESLQKRFLPKNYLYHSANKNEGAAVMVPQTKVGAPSEVIFNSVFLKPQHHAT